MNAFGLTASILMSLLAVVIILPDRTNAGCTCDAWCRGRGYHDGICGDGHTCICTGMDRSQCTCDAWCRGRGQQGGICGDGHTCICDGGRRRRSIEMPADIFEQKDDADFMNTINDKY